jgi:hypothetical protein
MYRKECCTIQRAQGKCDQGSASALLDLLLTGAPPLGSTPSTPAWETALHTRLQQQLLPNSTASHEVATASSNGIVQGHTRLAERPAGRQSALDPADVTTQLSAAEVLTLRSLIQEREARGGSGQAAAEQLGAVLH